MTTSTPTEILLGCDPQVLVRIVEDAGNLVIRVTATDPAVTDIDALFFNFTDDSVIPSLNIWPAYDEAIGSNGENVTGFEASVGTLNQLNNGAQVTEAYDCKIEYGTEAYTTGGDVDTAALTFWIDGGADGLSIDDIDLTNMTAVINSDSGEGLALTNGGGDGDGGTVYETTTVASDDFNDIHYAWQSDIVDYSGHWYAQNGELAANGCHDGNLWFNSVDVEGAAGISFDARAPHTDYFENGGCYGDTLEVWVLVNDSQWELLDTFTVNDEGTALVGDTTGQTITADSATLTYDGGALENADSIQLVLDADFTASNEEVFIDNVEFTDTVETTTGDTECVETEVASDSFDNGEDSCYYDPHSADDDLIAWQGNWDVENGELSTDGCNDGQIWFEEVATGGDTKISMDAQAPHTEYFEDGGCYGDSLQVWALVDGTDWQHLDTFVVNDEGTALVGDETGQTITAESQTLEWSGGELADAQTVQMYMYSDISASNEEIVFDDLSFSLCEDVPVDDGGDDDCLQYLVNYDEYGKYALTHADDADDADATDDVDLLLV